jgi:hypothetical protein
MNYSSSAAGGETAGGAIETTGKIVVDTSTAPLVPMQPDFPPNTIPDAAARASATNPLPSCAQAVPSVARIAANRANARKSTGPKTAAGKARVSRNARRHGLSRPLFCGGVFTPHVEALAREIAGENACGERLALACNIAAAQLDLARIRIAKRDLQDAANFGSTDAQHPCDWSALSRLERLDRYEQRVFTRRRKAIREFCKTKLLAGSAIEPVPAMPVTQGAAEDFCKTKPIPAAQSSTPVSVTVPDENVSDNSCKTNPTDHLGVDHLGVNPTPPQEVTVERFGNTKPSDANAALPACAAPTLLGRARQFLENKVNGQRCQKHKAEEHKAACCRYAHVGAFGAEWTCWISQRGPTFIRGP